MKTQYNERLNPRPYPTAHHVKFHIQKRSEAAGVAMCGGIYPNDRFNVFSLSFVERLDSINQCKCCMAEIDREYQPQLKNHV